MSEWSADEKGRRDRIIRELFADVAEEFIELVDQSKSGHVLVHFQRGLPGKTEWRFQGQIRRRLTGTDDG